MNTEEEDEGQQQQGWVGGQITGMKARQAEWMCRLRGGGGSEAVEQRDGLTPRGFQSTCSV